MANTSAKLRSTSKNDISPGDLDNSERKRKFKQTADDDGAAQPKDKRKRQEAASSDVEYAVRGILAERRGRYLIAWMPDAGSHEEFPSTWEPKGYANRRAVLEWVAWKHDNPAKKSRTIRDCAPAEEDKHTGPEDEKDADEEGAGAGASHTTQDHRQGQEDEAGQSDSAGEEIEVAVKTIAKHGKEASGGGNAGSPTPHDEASTLQAA